MIGAEDVEDKPANGLYYMKKVEDPFPEPEDPFPEPEDPLMTCDDGLRRWQKEMTGRSQQGNKSHQKLQIIASSDPCWDISVEYLFTAVSDKDSLSLAVEQGKSRYISCLYIYATLYAIIEYRVRPHWGPTGRVEWFRVLTDKTFYSYISRPSIQYAYNDTY